MNYIGEYDGYYIPFSRTTHLKTYESSSHWKDNWVQTLNKLYQVPAKTFVCPTARAICTYPYSEDDPLRSGRKLTEETMIETDFSQYYNYGYNSNQFASTSHNNYSSEKPGLRKTSHIKRPSDLMMTADASSNNKRPAGYIVFMESYGTDYYFFANPHGASGNYYNTNRNDKRFPGSGKSNILWADGHATTYSNVFTLTRANFEINKQ